MKFNRTVYITDVLWNVIAKSGLENQNGQNVPCNRISKSSWENKQEKKTVKTYASDTLWGQAYKGNSQVR